MKELSIERIERIEMVNGGGCSFEDLSVLSAIFFLGLGMYVTGNHAMGMVGSGASTLVMFACM